MAKKTEMQVLAFDIICPKCSSRQFSISPPGQIRPLEWSPEVLGLADCRGCNGNFLVKLPPELETALLFLLRFNKVSYFETMEALKSMFPN